MAPGHVIVERLSRETPAAGSGMDTGGIEVERVRSFSFMLSILSELTRHCFCCCQPGLGHRPVSLGDTVVAVWPFPSRAGLLCLHL